MTESVFQAADDGLAETIELAEAGDGNEAVVTFLAAVHDLTHNLDGPLRQVEEALAVHLCNEVVILEVAAIGDAEPSIVAKQARLIREVLIAAAAALGISPR